ncbi:MAG: nucleoside-diphosphate-sugar pyrophosphorylase [Planctomycetaceae bacterium]|nr:nucleoside-diphosphate-sugar pyrophosphorylase [Planctomycetaceae bacterium]MBP63330.1 nucleoside-diphosphate-sugar pyrophosphorylase [Planctomycetaceae bacterium]
MHAVILAGGEGQRLRPYTAVLPKPLMPLHNQPILEIIVGQLRDAGFDRFTFAVGYLAGLIQAYFSDGDRFGVSIDYSLEEQSLGTAGPLSLLENLDDHFLVMNGDILTNLDYTKFMETHQASGALATLAVFEKEVPISLGVLDIDDGSNIVNYTEKPTLYYPVSTGIYCFRAEVLDHLEKGVHCDLPTLVTRLVTAGETVRAYRFDGLWLDIGRPEDYEIALEEFEKGAL